MWDILQGAEFCTSQRGHLIDPDGVKAMLYKPVKHQVLFSSFLIWQTFRFRPAQAPKILPLITATFSKAEVIGHCFQTNVGMFCLFCVWGTQLCQLEHKPNFINFLAPCSIRPSHQRSLSCSRCRVAHHPKPNMGFWLSWSVRRDTRFGAIRVH